MVVGNLSFGFPQSITAENQDFCFCSVDKVSFFPGRVTVLCQFVVKLMKWKIRSFRQERPAHHG
jgi:hypothetical protein